MLGPSGCGKTTILRCIAGLETPDAGEIGIGGRTVYSGAGGVLVPPESRNLGMVFQSYAIWPHMTVGQNVAFGLRVRRRSRREIRQAVGDALALVQLEGYEGRFPTQLSGGQMQRVVLARCLAYRPSLLLLDEPLANLDTQLRVEMRAELRRIQRQTGTTMIAVTHDQAEALSLSDTVLVMQEGRVLQAGPPREVFRQPNSPFVAAFLGSTNQLGGRVAGPDRVTLAGLGDVSVRSGLPVGTAVRLCARTTDLVLSRPGDPPGAMSGRIVTTQYLGDKVEYVIEAGGHRLIAEERRSETQHREGETVAIAFNPAHLLVYPQPEGEAGAGGGAGEVHP
jgi:ABC-type Fe3+/spermidine/putrescine transport system ATPase subunit